MSEEIRKDTLFVALTRPAMKWGVPWQGLILNMLISFAVGSVIGRGNPFYWTMFIPIHLVMRALTSMDHNFFRVRMLQIETKGRSIGSDVWGGSSLAPLPIWPARSASETRGSV